MTIDNDPVAKAIREVYPYRVDLEDCDQEPLRHISVVQSFACLLVVDRKDRTVTHVSDNAATFLGRAWRDVLGRPLNSILGSEVVSQISLGLEREQGFDSLNPIQTFIRGAEGKWLANVIAHRQETSILLEIERAEVGQQTSVYQQLLARAVRRIQNLNQRDELFAETAEILRQLTDFDRVMVYQFDREFNGEVIAESLRPDLDLEPFRGLRYPHTDIPTQARDLYLVNRVRLIGNVEGKPSKVHALKPDGDGPLDLTRVSCRGCSPVHLEYLGYMGVSNTLSVAIVLEGKLWGLFAMHHYSARTVDYGMRNLLMFIGDIFSGHLALQSATRYRELTLRRNLVRLGIGEQIVKTRDIFAGLTSGTYGLLEVFPGVNGSCVHFEKRTECYGDTPDGEDISALIDWVVERQRDDEQLVFSHDSVGKEYKPFEKYCDDAAGVLVIFLSPDFSDWIIWFRPGMSRTVTWAGRPEKRTIQYDDGSQRLGPRRSFERYVQSVDGCSSPWLPEEIDAAFALRITVINGLMQHYAEVKQINERLKKAYEDLETFSYTVSHDLRAPLRAINGYSEILNEDYGHLLDEEGKLLIAGIQRGVDQMNNFITDILDLSRVGSGGLKPEKIAVGPVVQQVIDELRPVYAQRGTEVTIDPSLPTVVADARLLRQLLTNLISNAYKYMEPSAGGELALAVAASTEVRDGLERTVFHLSNTGPGIPEEYRRGVFDMFSRLSTQKVTEGTGVGLAIVDRIVGRHHGEVWITNDRLGVTFNFYLAINQGG